MMKTISPWQWMLVDVANQFGHDKMTFEDRINWAENNLNSLEAMTDKAETKPLYVKGVMAIRKAQKGLPTGHMIGLDACCSGIQVMSAMTGCIAGATSTGMVNPNVRADAYKGATDVMARILGNSVGISRADAKQALMTSFYGSKAMPKTIFGEDTPELEAFYEAAQEVAPGAWELLQDLLKSWQPYALSHNWKLPDGYDARVKVMNKREARVEVDELDHATFTYEYYDNVGSKDGLSNVANVTHSMDAYILRSMHRRCNYDREVVETANQLMKATLARRAVVQAPEQATGKVLYYVQQYERSTLADVVILPCINEETVRTLGVEHMEALVRITDGMLSYKPFPMVTVHDEFKAHPNNINDMRYQYREIMAEIADSDVLDDLLSQVYQAPMSFNKLSFNLGDYIRKSEYALS